MLTEIGHTAGKIWEALGQKGEISVDYLPRAVKAKSAVAYQALGWLAKEDKIQYKKKNGKNVVSLTPMEQNSYRMVTASQ